MQPNKLSSSILAVIEGSKGDKARKAVEAPDSLFSISHARIVDLLSEGEIEGFVHGADFLRDVYFDETPIQNADGTRNFKNLQVDARTGTQDQSYIPGFPAVENELGIGIELKQVTPWTQSFTNKSLSAVRVRLGVQSLSKGDSETGDVKGTTVQYAMDIATDGGAFVEVMRSAMTGKSSGAYERGHRLELPKSTVSGWIIRVRRLTADTTTQYLNNKTSVVSCTEVIDGKFRYPMSAVAGIQVDSSQFPNIPTRAYHVRGRKIRIPANYDPSTRTYATTGTGTSGGAWDGTFKTVYSNNPAWVFYDMTTHRRYGLGKLVDELVIDKWSLYAIGQYCDETVPDGFGGTEPRMTCNLYLQKAADAWKVIGDLSSIFRGICYWAGGSIIPVADRPSDPVYTYTNANVVGGAFRYQSTGRRARHTAVIVSYNDMTDFCRLKSDYYDDPEGIARFGFQLAEVNAMGCTSRGQAQRFAKWLLYTEKLLTNTAAFAVGPEGTYGAPGQIIRIADKHRAGRRIGGRIRSATESNVVLDKLPEVAPMAGDTLIVTLPEGYTESRTVSSVVGDGINVSVPFTAIPVPESVWAVESTDLSTQLFRLLGTEKTDDGGYSMIAMQHNPSIFDAVDLGEAISVPPTSVIPSPNQMRPASVTVSSVERAGQVIAMPLLSAAWPAATGAVKYQIQWQKDEGDWTTPQEVSGTSADYQTPFPGVYIAKVQALNALGITSVPQYSLPYTLADQSMTPGFVAQLNLDIAAALDTAENAQATADGVIEFFWQDTPPVIGTGVGQAREGDFWVDTNDGNHQWRVTGGIFVDAQDDAIGDAATAAFTAQSTADGKTKLFVGPAAPVSGYQLNDLWFNDVLKKTSRYNGTNWSQEIADVTLDQIGGSGVNLLDSAYSTFSALPPASSSTQATASLDAAKTVVDGALKLTFPAGPYVWYYFGSLGGIVYLSAGDYIVSAWVASSLASQGTSLTLRGPSPSTANYSSSAGSTSATTGTMVRLSAVVTVPANGLYALALDPVDQGAAVNFWVDGVMIEAQVGTRNAPSAYSRGTLASGLSTVIASASTAQSTADGKIDTFFQTTMPAGTLGDLWFDTDDGNKQYRHNGSTFVIAQDTAIGTAITAAAGAQATADGKVTTFYVAAAPVAEGVGDLWVDTDDKNKLYRWSGSAWVAIRDATIADAQSTANTAVTNAATAQAAANTANTDLANIASDSLLTPGEKPTVIKERDVIVAEQAGIDAKATALAITTEKTAYDSAVSALIAYLATLATPTLWSDLAGNTTIVGATFRQKFLDVYAARQTLLNKIAVQTLDDLPDGPTYGRPLKNRLNAGRPWIDFNENVHFGKNLDNIGDGTTYRRPGAGYVDASGRVTTMWDDETGLPRTGGYVGGGASRARTGLGTDGRLVAGYNDADRISEAPTRKWAAQSGADITANVVGKGLIVNPDFDNLLSGWSTEGGPAWYIGPGDGFQSSSGAVLYGANNPAAACALMSQTVMPCRAGDLIRISGKIRRNSGTGNARLIAQFLNTVTGYTGHLATPNVVTSGTTAFGDVFAVGAAPVNTDTVRVFFEVTGYDGFGAWVVDNARLSWLAGIDDTPDGTLYGRTSQTDLVSNRIGLNIKGSRRILGGARNSRASMVAGFNSVRSTTALTANSSGQISVNAHNVEISGETVTYNAVTNAIVGATVGVTYVVYTLDPFLDGGTRTYYTQTSILSAQQAGEGAVHIGNVTIPSSGTGTGGGDGTGDPDNWCVDWDTVLPDGRLVRELSLGDLVECINVHTGETGMFPLLGMGFGEEDCYRLVTKELHSIIQSKSTPMDLPDGRIMQTPEMFGHPVYATIGGEPILTLVADLQYLGLRRVVKPDFGNRMFFAGESADKCLATHNAYNKP